MSLEPSDVYIDETQAAYWLERNDVDAFCRIVLGYAMTPATRPFGISAF